jgi:hypothetical protein
MMKTNTIKTNDLTDNLFFGSQKITDSIFANPVLAPHKINERTFRETSYDCSETGIKPSGLPGRDSTPIFTAHGECRIAKCLNDSNLPLTWLSVNSLSQDGEQYTFSAQFGKTIFIYRSVSGNMTLTQYTEDQIL